MVGAFAAARPMIHPSFIPPRSIRELARFDAPAQEVALSAATAEKNRVQKVLEDANVKLGNVLFRMCSVFPGN